MRVALSAKVRENEFGVMSHMQWEKPKMSMLVQRLKDLGMFETLFVTGEPVVPSALEMAMRNIQRVKVVGVNDLKIADLLKWRRIVLRGLVGTEAFSTSTSRSCFSTAPRHCSPR